MDRIQEQRKFPVAVIIILFILAAAAFAMCFFFFMGRTDEAFSDVRAYRTEVSEDGSLPEEPLIVYPSESDDNMQLRTRAAEAYQILNDERKAQGLEPLIWSQPLEICSYVRVEEISYSFTNDHSRPSGAEWFTVDPTVELGENIYKGYREPDKAMASWIKNPADRDNFFCADFETVAISVYENDKGETFWTAVFGRKR